MKPIDETLERLKGSKFRSSFRLSRKDMAYALAKGERALRRHARDFVEGRLGDAFPENDGKQTPMSGHPIFKAMHATACCCRGCMSKWHGVVKGRVLTDEEKGWAVELLIAWVERECAEGGAELLPEGADAVACVPSDENEKIFQEKLF